jgi:hypothetical protein
MAASAVRSSRAPSRDRWTKGGASLDSARDERLPYCTHQSNRVWRWTRRPHLAIALADGSVAEWSKAHAWKVCRGLKLLQGSNPCRSATLEKGWAPQSLTLRLAAFPHRRLRHTDTRCRCAGQCGRICVRSSFPTRPIAIDDLHTVADGDGIVLVFNKKRPGRGIDSH